MSLCVLLVGNDRARAGAIRKRCERTTFGVERT